MKKIKVLNLYACLGGNRAKWDEVADIKVTAVELDPELARMYKERFPNDVMIVADAHQYLLDHYKEFDFIWTSPPCPTHSKVRISQKNTKAFKPEYPDMELYEEIIFLQNYFTGKFVVENVISYYDPLIKAQKRGRHLYWCNFNLPKDLKERKDGVGLIGGAKDEVSKFCVFHEIDLTGYRGMQRKDKIARNLVDYEVGRVILETALNIQRENNQKQQLLFE